MRPPGEGIVSNEVAGQQAEGFAVQDVVNCLNYCKYDAKDFISSDSLIRTITFWASATEDIT